MDDRSFEELIGDLLGQGMRVYVSTESGTYHYSRSCLESLVTKGKVRRCRRNLRNGWAMPSVLSKIANLMSNKEYPIKYVIGHF